MKNVITNFVKAKTSEISLQNSKLMMRRKNTSSSSVIAVKKRDIMSMNALHSH